MLSHARPFDGFKELFFGFISFAQDPSRVYNLQDKNVDPKRKSLIQASPSWKASRYLGFRSRFFLLLFLLKSVCPHCPCASLPMIVQQARNAHKDDVSQKESNGQNYYNKPSVTTSVTIQSKVETSWLLNFFKEISNSKKKCEQEDAQ